jgi:hypothetical protein
MMKLHIGSHLSSEILLLNLAEVAEVDEEEEEEEEEEVVEEEEEGVEDSRNKELNNNEFY